MGETRRMRAEGKRPYPAMQPAGQREMAPWNVFIPPRHAAAALPRLACTPAAPYNTAAGAAPPALTPENG